MIEEMIEDHLEMTEDHQDTKTEIEEMIEAETIEDHQEMIEAETIEDRQEMTEDHQDTTTETTTEIEGDHQEMITLKKEEIFVMI